MAFFVALLIFSVICGAMNEPIPVHDSGNGTSYDGPFAGIINAFTGNENQISGRIFSIFKSRNKSCGLANGLGFGNASCILYCVVNGYQTGGFCASDSYCTCIV